jgi:hypothetical protein
VSRTTPVRRGQALADLQEVTMDGSAPEPKIIQDDRMVAASIYVSKSMIRAILSGENDWMPLVRAIAGYRERLLSEMADGRTDAGPARRPE